jgi:hypothetical protein
MPPASPRLNFHGPWAALALTAALLCAGPLARAQGDRVHTVQPGDNLYDLAQRYLDDPKQWNQLQRLNRIAHPRRLLPGSQLVIPAALARPEPASAEVLHVAGPASVQSGPQASATALAAGARVNEGAQIDVGEDGFVTLRLADGSVVRLAAGTQVRLRELRHAPAPGHAQSGLDLERGRVDATVKPLPSPRSRFEVRTPRAVGGVRGTTFGVAVDGGGDLIGDVREGAIQVRSRAAPPGAAGTRVQAGQGARVGRTTTLVALLAPPDLSRVPDVVEHTSGIELPLARDPGAAAWQVRIASDDDAERVVRNATFQQPLARFAALDDGPYLLSVRAIDAHGIPGTEAIRRLVVNARPTAPLLREPRQGTRVVGPSVTLLCTEGVGAVGYRFEIARDAGFTDLVAHTPDLAQCEHTVRPLEPGDYVWRVAAIARDVHGERDQGPFSQPVPFRVVALPPAPSTPSMTGADADTLRVSWNSSPGGPWRHELQLAHDEAFTRLLDEPVLDDAAFTRPMPPAGTYHLRVRQIDADGLRGTWSEPQRLEVHHRIVTSDTQPLTSTEGKPVLRATH